MESRMDTVNHMPMPVPVSEGGAEVSIVEKQAIALENAAAQLVQLAEKCLKLRKALQRIRDCDFVITLPDRMDAVRAIAREALE